MTTKFPSSFWTANTVELFERAAYYAMASFVVIYLGQLGFGKYWPSFINAFLWGMLFFLQILSGTIADQIGYKRALLIAFILLMIGYFAMGYPAWFGGHTLLEVPGSKITVTMATILPVCFGILFIGVGGSFVKPSIAGTVHRTAGDRRALGFAIFFMVIGLGNLIGRLVAFIVRRTDGFNLSAIFLVSCIAAIVAFFLVVFFFNDPDIEMGQTEKKPSKPVGIILLDMVKVLKNLKFTVFLLITSGFYLIHAQMYNILPLYAKKTIELLPAMDIYTAANPLIIVTGQLLITKLFGKLPPVKSIFVGTIIAALSMLINIIPLYVSGGTTQIIGNIIPLGSMFVILTVVMIAFGELFKGAKLYEYIASFAPKGQEALYQGYSNLPLAIGSITGGFIGAWVFNEIICRNAVELPSKLLLLDTRQATIGWLILTFCGLISALSMFLYNWWIKVTPRGTSLQET